MNPNIFIIRNWTHMVVTPPYAGGSGAPCACDPGGLSPG
jgi:hypothetical protein